MFRSATRPWGEKYPNAARHIDRPEGYSRKRMVVVEGDGLSQEISG
jgi:hypothetical protein